MNGEQDIDSIDDEDLLRTMLEKSDDLECRRRIRSRLRAINKTKPAGDQVDGASKLQHPPARVNQPKETRAAAAMTSRKPDDASRQTRQTTAATNSPRNEHQSVTLRTVESKPSKPRDAAKSGFVENVALRKVGDVKPTGEVSTSKPEFIDKKMLRKVDDVKSPCETSRKTTGQHKSEFLEVVTLRKVEGSKPSTESSTVRPTARSLTPKMAMEHFKGMDTGIGGDRSPTRRSLSPSNIRQAMLDWCRYRVTGYEKIDIVDFSGSWSDGLAFCALVHSFFPDAFDYDELDATNRRHNFELAFTTADTRGGVFPLLEVDDMIRAGPAPDWKCVFTYVNSIYTELAAPKKKLPDETTADVLPTEEEEKEEEEEEAGAVHYEEKENQPEIDVTQADD